MSQNEAILFVTTFFLLMTAAKFLLGTYGSLCSHVGNFPLWYFVVYEVPADSYWIGVSAYFLLHAVLYGVKVMPQKEENKKGEANG